jgi:hypothetical protein
MKMTVYTKHGQRITNESARVDESCYFGDKIIKNRAMPESKKKQQIYWVKDLLADGAKAEIESLIADLKPNS